LITPKISLGSWAFSFGPFEKDPWSFSRVCDYAADAGYDGIEINGFRPHPHPDDYDTRVKCAELKHQISDLGLGISGYAPDFRHVPPAEVETATFLKTVDKMLAFCNRMDITILRTDTISPPLHYEADVYEARFKKLAQNWHAAAEACRQAGVVLVWEYEPGFWLNKPGEVVRMLQAVGHDSFKALFDTSHSYMGSVVGARQTGQKEILSGGVADYAQLLQGFIGHLHLIDSDGTLHDEETSTHTPFGEGFIDFEKVLTALRPSLDDVPWWCVDFCFCSTTETDARKAIPFLNNLIKML
jgi:sugar phosphate isomerase/epimerase